MIYAYITKKNKVIFRSYSNTLTDAFDLVERFWVKQDKKDGISITLKKVIDMSDKKDIIKKYKMDKNK